MARVFLSYSTKDSLFADLAILKLQNAGIDVWIDHESLVAGEEWRNAIDAGISGSCAVVVLLTPDSCESPYVTYEWGFAIGRGIKVIPILLKDADIHPRLSALQYLDFRDQRNGPWASLYAEIKQSAACVSEETTRETIGRLGDRIEEQSHLIRELVQAVRPKDGSNSVGVDRNGLTSLVGAWRMLSSGGNAYGRYVDDQLFVPYCYADDDHLTAVHYDWSRIGELMFCRFQWFDSPTGGFAFFKQVDSDTLHGSWWTQDNDSDMGIPAETLVGQVDPLQGGVRVEWKRHNEDKRFPRWATEYLDNPTIPATRFE